MTECITNRIVFQSSGRRNITADFSGGIITSDAGALLLKQTDDIIRLLDRFADCFTDHRDPDRVEHSVRDLVAQRVYGIALGYEDLNDHDDLSLDPLLAAVCGKADPTGAGRKRERDRSRPLATRSTLNRLELTPESASAASRYKKVVYHNEMVESLLLDLFLEAYDKPPDEIVIDLDATDDPLHGKQEGRFFHGYYNEYCYLPLYAFCGNHLLVAQLRPSNIDASLGSVYLLEQIVGRIRIVWPETAVIIRGDSGFCREKIMSWCEGEAGVDYIFGLAKNSRLTKMIEEELDGARLLYEESGKRERIFKELRYKTLKSWNRQRRVVAKAEHLPKGANPRFVVTSLSPERFEARALYEDLYCARGEMENRIKEQQLCMFADRTSSNTIRANQLRLFFSSMAYVLTSALRRLGLGGTPMARARCDTIRLKLMKIGAFIKVSARRIWVRITSAFPYKHIFVAACKNLQFRPLRC